MAPILRRAARGVYWIGLLAGPFLGTAALVGAAFVAVHQLGVELGFLPLIYISVGLLLWIGLTWAYRTVVPLPCLKCGGVARATSLNPVTVRCGSCGYMEVSQTRILGAP